MHILYILADGVKKFWADYLALKRKYPEVFLGYKEDQIKQFILRKEKTWRTDRQGITKNLLVNLLQKKSRTIKELARLLSISRQGIRFHLKGLEKLGVVKKLGVGKARSDVYGLIKYIQVPVTKKGRSRQYGITAEKITQLLMECGNLDTKQISKKLKMRRSSVFALLKKLEKEGKIVVVGKKVYNTHPANIWALR
jgi:predicted ArsR family transcriptional regulator